VLGLRNSRLLTSHDATPLGLMEFALQPQGSSCLATLGFKMIPLWGSSICPLTAPASLEDEFVVFDVGGDGVAIVDFVVEDLHAEGVEDFALDDAFEGACAVGRVVALAPEPFGGFVGDFEGEVLFGEAVGEAVQLDFDDFADLGVGEAVEDDDFVDAVEEFGAEVAAEGFEDAAVAFFFWQVFHDELAAEVRGHDDDGVLEIDGVALSVGDAAIVEHLEEDVEDVGVGFFDFVEQDDAVRLAADGFAELAALFVSDVAGRCPDEAGHGVFFHVFAHVESDDGSFVVEEEFGEGFGEFGFSDAGGSEEHERADRAVFVLEAGAGAADGVGDGGDRLMLPDDAFHEALFHFDEFFAFAFLEAGDGNSGPGRDDFCDILFGHFFFEEGGPGGRFAGGL